MSNSGIIESRTLNLPFDNIDTDQIIPAQFLTTTQRHGLGRYIFYHWRFQGLHQIFIDAGAEWREPGCSMCLGMNGDIAQPGELVVSTSNRNFKGRQGQGSRSILASPLTAAACAISGQVSDPRPMMEAQIMETRA